METIDWADVRQIGSVLAEVLPFLVMGGVFGGMAVVTRRRKKMREVFLKYGNTRSWQVVIIKKTMIRANKVREQWELYKVELESQGQRILVKVWHPRRQVFPVTKGDAVTSRFSPNRSDVAYFPEMSAWRGAGWFDRPKKYFPPEMTGVH